MANSSLLLLRRTPIRQDLETELRKRSRWWTRRISALRTSTSEASGLLLRWEVCREQMEIVWLSCFILNAVKLLRPSNIFLTQCPQQLRISEHCLAPWMDLWDQSCLFQKARDLVPIQLPLYNQHHFVIPIPEPNLDISKKKIFSGTIFN